MAHSLTVAAVAAAAAAGNWKSKSPTSKSNNHYSSSSPIPAAGHEALPHHHSISVPRRTLVGGAVVLGLSLRGESQSAFAAARRPPPPPPEEKKDPNVSGVQAKVMASKKRKETLKQSVAKLREKGTPVKQPQPPQ